MTRYRISSSAVVVVLASTCSSFADAPSFQGLGNLPGYAYSWASAISADGTTVIGTDGASPSHLAFRWTAATGWSAISPSAGGFAWDARGISSDGAVVVGSGTSPAQAVRWTEASGAVLQGTPHGQYDVYSRAYAISGDGQTMVGEAARLTDTMCHICYPPYSAYALAESRAFRQVGAGNALRTLDPLSGYSSCEANSVSGDGAIVVGSSFEWACGCFPVHTNSQACMWIDTGAPGAVALALGYLPGQTNSAASAVSADGLVVVGGSGGRAFRWTMVTGMVDLGASSPAPIPAQALSADGAIIVGYDAAVGAFIWEPTHGMRELRAVLETELGLNLAGWTLYSANGVSADGRTIVGGGLNPAGELEAWIAFLGDALPPPCPCDLNGDHIVDLTDLAMLLAHFGMAGGATLADGDIDADGDVDLGDLAALLASFGTVCPGP